MKNADGGIVRCRRWLLLREVEDYDRTDWGWPWSIAQRKPSVSEVTHGNELRTVSCEGVHERTPRSVCLVEAIPGGELVVSAAPPRVSPQYETRLTALRVKTDTYHHHGFVKQCIRRNLSLQTTPAVVTFPRNDGSEVSTKLSHRKLPCISDL